MGRVVTGHVGDLVGNPADQQLTSFGAGHLAAPEHDRHLDPFTGFEEPADVADLHVEVGRPDVGPELHLSN